MTTVYLFDWGDTLMVDFPETSGKMKDWEFVEAVDGAVELLEVLSKNSKLYVATGAADSDQNDIESAFCRVGLSKYISGYYCLGNVGFVKGSIDYLKSILMKLEVGPKEVTVVGDNYEKDIVPALEAGTYAIWLNGSKSDETIENLRIVPSLRQVCL